MLCITQYNIIKCIVNYIWSDNNNYILHESNLFAYKPKIDLDSIKILTEFMTAEAQVDSETEACCGCHHVILYIT